VGVAARVPDRLRIAYRAVTRAYQLVAIIALNTVICFVCLELMSAGLATLHDLAMKSGAAVDSRASSPYYASQKWAAQYWREFGASRSQAYHPFVLWRRRGFAGETINISASGVRSTPNARCVPGALKVLVFGGSTVWGTGVPDWGTLPAYLQAELQRRHDGPVCVVNYGESAYVSTQSLVQLLLLLQSGSAPDLVVFYEGLNDAYSAYQSGVAGAHENLKEMAASVEGSRKPHVDFLGEALRRTNLFRVSRYLISGLTHRKEGQPRLETYESKGTDLDSIASQIAGAYFVNYQIVEGLATKFGFDFWLIWPSYIRSGGKPLVAAETEIANNVDPALDRLYQAVHRRVAAGAAAHSRLLDMTTAFDAYPDLLWLDEVHVTADGNRLLAASIAASVTVDWTAESRTEPRGRRLQSIRSTDQSQ
jgi:lysophospholipase L1-like esterase